MDKLDKREMVFWVAEYNRSRHWKTARGSASACWGVLCGEQEADPLELEIRGWRVVKCVATAVETDLRFRAATFRKQEPASMAKKPHPGDAFFREFERNLQDLRDEGEEDRVHWATITEVRQEIEDNDGATGWSVTCDDDIGYDCFWSEACQAWVYGLGNGYHPSET